MILSTLLGGLLNGKGKLSTPSVASLLVPPVSGGQSVTTGERYHPLSPPETGRSTPQGGRGWIKPSAHFVVTKFATTLAPA